MLRLMIDHADMRNRIAEIRRERGWNQAELAHRVGVSQSTISRLEAGDLNATLGTISDVAGALQVRFVELFEKPTHFEAEQLASIWSGLTPDQRAFAETVLRSLPAAIPAKQE